MPKGYYFSCGYFNFINQEKIMDNIKSFAIEVEGLNHEYLLWNNIISFENDAVHKAYVLKYHVSDISLLDNLLHRNVILYIQNGESISMTYQPLLISQHVLLHGVNAIEGMLVMDRDIIWNHMIGNKRIIHAHHLYVKGPELHELAYSFDLNKQTRIEKTLLPANAITVPSVEVFRGSAWANHQQEIYRKAMPHKIHINWTEEDVSVY